MLANDTVVEPRRSTRVTRPIDRFAYAVEYLRLPQGMTFNQLDFADAYEAYVPDQPDPLYAMIAEYDVNEQALDYVDPSLYHYFHQRAPVQVPRLFSVYANVADVYTRPPVSGNYHQNPSALVSAIDNDTFIYHQAMQQPDWEEFLKAGTLEVKTLEQMVAWREVKRSTVPRNMKVLGGTWVFRRKRNPEGKIIKYKARYCVRGDQQIAGIDYFESYAPVTQWSTV